MKHHNAENSRLNELSGEFFREFSRYEYCLKVTKLRNQEGKVSADWDKYATQVQIDFEAPTDPEVAEAINYYMTHPPKLQIVRDNELVWDEALPVQGNKAVLVLMLIRRMRNNLFHGGKFNDQWFEPQRSEELLHYALIILKACAQNHPRVLEAYNGAESVG